VSATRRASLWILYSLTAVGVILIFELLLLPYRHGLPRDAFLMGFAAPPGSLVDDTPINAMGFTGDMISPRKPPNTIRILTLGGSSMFNRRMTERLRDRLERISTSPLEVLGAALRKHTSTSSILKYTLLRKYRFDFVLIYHGINDLWANHVSLADFRPDYSHLDAWYKRNLILDNCVTCRIIYNRWIYARPPPRLMGDLSTFPSEQIFKRNIMKLIAAIREDGATPILMSFAWNIPVDYTYEAFQSNSLGYRNPENYDRWPAELWGPPEYVREGLQRNNRIISELARTEGVLLIDQETLMGKSLQWFGDPVHFSDEGVERFIANIGEFFLAQGLFRPASSEIDSWKSLPADPRGI